MIRALIHLSPRHRKLLAVIKPHWKPLVLAGICMLVMAGGEAATAWLMLRLARRLWPDRAAGALLAFGFEKLALNKIYATHLIENPASGQVMMKNGMIREGELKDHYKKDDAYRTVVQYRLTGNEFDNMAAKPTHS